MKFTTNLKNCLFLLGGYDLEMVEIKKLLKTQEIDFLDLKLKWGASWLDYKKGASLKNIEKALDEEKTLVAIELDDFPKGYQYHLIDHHNEKQSEVSSIEQVADLLGVELTSWQQLAAANDHGYIPAMLELGASGEDIQKIRAADRKAQGVTLKDEKLAEQSIQNKEEHPNGLVIIQALTSKFSPIADQLYGKVEKLLIYNKDHLNYYGKYKERLEGAKAFESLFESKRTYHGGGPSGFFGIHSISSEEEREKWVTEITTLLEVKKLDSYHVFMFPFTWKLWEEHPANTTPITLDDKKRFEKLTKKLLAGHWKEHEFELNTGEAYNEYNYFYPHVREILYDQAEELRIKSSEQNKFLIKHFRFGKKPNDLNLEYIINLGNGNKYTLEVGSILLNVYNTGTAILSFHLRNYQHSDPKDILKINQFGRRIFPPSYQLNKNDDWIELGKPDDTFNTYQPNEFVYTELPISIELRSGNDTNPPKLFPLIEKFDRYQDKDHLKYGPFVIPKFIEGLFPKQFMTCHEKEILVDNKTAFMYIRPVLDDRMYVISGYRNTSKVESLNQYHDASKNYNYAKDPWWYQYVFIDNGGSTLQNKQTFEKTLDKHTYSRWVDCGTLYGTTKYSFVMLVGDGAPTYLMGHLQTLYYKLIELCLMQQATLLQFSDEITHVVSEPKEDVQLKNIQTLYRKYLLFINKIYFREVTAQEQGIELYDMIQREMNLPVEVLELDREMQELHQLVMTISNQKRLETEKRSSELLRNISIIGAIFLPITLMISIFGMPNMPETIWDLNGKPHVPFWQSLGMVLILSSLLIGIASVGLKLSVNNTDKKKRLILFKPVVIILVTLAVFGFLCFLVE